MQSDVICPSSTAISPLGSRTSFNGQLLKTAWTTPAPASSSTRSLRTPVNAGLLPRGCVCDVVSRLRLDAEAQLGAFCAL